MNDLIELLEKLVAYKKYILSGRFFPLFVVLSVWLVILNNFSAMAWWVWPAIIMVTAFIFVRSFWEFPWEKEWLDKTERLIDECDFIQAKKLLEEGPLLIGYAIKVRACHALYKIEDGIGEINKAHLALQAMNAKVLLPQERMGFTLSMAGLFYHAGNYKRFSELYESLDESVLASDSKRYFSYLMLSAFYFEMKGLFSQAILSLEKAVELPVTLEAKIAAFNNLARLEVIQENKSSAISYFEKAYFCLLEISKPYLFHTVVHNLVLNKVICGGVNEGLVILEKFHSRVDEGNVNQLSEFLNLKIEVARQIGDRTLLIETYNQAERELKPRLGGEMLLAHAVSELTMRFNDQYEFREYLEEFIPFLVRIKELPLDQRLHALYQVYIIFSRYINNEGRADGVAKAAFEEVCQSLLKLDYAASLQLRNISPSLPSARDRWHLYQIELHKIRMYGKSGVTLHDMSILFDRLKERRKVWKNKENIEREIFVLFLICENYLMGTDLLENNFSKDFYDLAECSLMEAGELLDRSWPHPELFQYAMGIGYFYRRILDDKSSALYWVRKFEKTMINPLNYALELRKQYFQTKDWLASSS